MIPAIFLKLWPHITFCWFGRTNEPSSRHFNRGNYSGDWEQHVLHLLRVATSYPFTRNSLCHLGVSCAFLEVSTLSIVYFFDSHVDIAATWVDLQRGSSRNLHRAILAEMPPSSLWWETFHLHCDHGEVLIPSTWWPIILLLHGQKVLSGFSQS